MKSRIMYIERKAGSLTGAARIGRVTFNRSGRTIRYQDQVFHRIVGGGFKSNHTEEATGEEYWISGCKRAGGDALYTTNIPPRSMRMRARSTGARSGIFRRSGNGV